MTTDELAAEARWLLSYRVHPTETAQALGHTPSALAKRFGRAGHTELRNVFEAAATRERHWGAA
jgi:hypothetical protein